MKQHLTFCNGNNILVESPSGLRGGHSCQFVVLNVCDRFKALEKGRVVLMVFLGFEWTFKTIDRSLDFKKLCKIPTYMYC